jgi:hypothetical protein
MCFKCVLKYGDFIKNVRYSSLLSISSTGFSDPNVCKSAILWQHAHRGRKECVDETVFGSKGQGKKMGLRNQHRAKRVPARGDP